MTAHLHIRQVPTKAEEVAATGAFGLLWDVSSVGTCDALITLTSPARANEQNGFFVYDREVARALAAKLTEWADGTS